MEMWLQERVDKLDDSNPMVSQLKRMLTKSVKVEGIEDGKSGDELDEDEEEGDTVEEGGVEGDVSLRASQVFMLHLRQRFDCFPSSVAR